MKFLGADVDFTGTANRPQSYFGATTAVAIIGMFVQNHHGHRRPVGPCIGPAAAAF